MKLSLLDMVQGILGSMNSDAVNSLGDTQESLDVARIIRDTYFELVAQRDWPWLNELTSLDGVGDVATPTKLKIPETVRRVWWVKYNKQNPDDTLDELNYQPVCYSPPDEFCWRQSRLNSSIDEVTTTFENGARLMIWNDKHPTYWTSFDDDFIIMDAFNKDFESTLQQSNNTIWAQRITTWETKDTFIPDLPDHLFPFMLAEAKSTCFVDIKQAANEKAEQKSRRQLLTQQKRSWKQDGKPPTPDYGRNPRGGHRSRAWWRHPGQRQDGTS